MSAEIMVCSFALPICDESGDQHNGLY